MEINAVEEYSEDEGVTITLRDREGNPEEDNGKPLTLKLAGQYSKRYQKAVRHQREKNLKKRSFQIDVDYLEEAPKEIEAACIIEWPFTSGGQPWPITTKNYSALLRVKPWYQDQIREGIERYASFFSANSAS